MYILLTDLGLQNLTLFSAITCIYSHYFIIFSAQLAELFKRVKMLCDCMWTSAWVLTGVAQIVTAAHILVILLAQTY